MWSEPVFLKSPVHASHDEKGDIQKVKIEALDPCFYRALAQAKDAADILVEQMRPRGDDADPSAKVLLVNEPDMLTELVGGLHSVDPLQHQRRKTTAYALDEFVHSHVDPSLATAYWAATRWYRMADFMMIRLWSV
jgi:hypothetical protein